jgi:superfamily I DNA and/or RNA helicase
MVFIDVRGQEQRVWRSLTNRAEAEAVAGVVAALCAQGVSPSRIGIICLYRAQAETVRALVAGRLPRLAEVAEEAARTMVRFEANKRADDDADDEGQGGPGSDGEDEQCSQGDAEDGPPHPAAGTGLRISTVDSFQGAECDAIILTTCITRSGGAFAADACRVNVALTRAKNNLVVVGSAQALQGSSPAFAALLAQARGTPGGYGIGGRLPTPMELTDEKEA